MCSPYKKIKGKRLLASWKQDYLLKVLSGLSHIENQDAFALSICYQNFPYANFPNQPRRIIHLAISNTGIIVTAKPPTISQSTKGRE